MYKYLCVISDNADKRDFYDTVDKVKNCYPNFTEDTSAKFERASLGQVLDITDDQGTTSKIYIKYDYTTKQLFVMSEAYLNNFFEGRKIANISIYSNKPNKAVKTILSIFFTAFNIAIPLLLYRDEFEIEFDLRFFISLTSLFAVYIISSLLMNRKSNISVLDVSFIQFGGYPMIAAALTAIAYVLIDNNWGGLGVIIKSLIILKTVVPALALSATIQFMISALKNKSNSK